MYVHCALSCRHDYNSCKQNYLRARTCDFCNLYVVMATANCYMYIAQYTANIIPYWDLFELFCLLVYLLRPESKKGKRYIFFYTNLDSHKKFRDASFKNLPKKSSPNCFSSQLRIPFISRLHTFS